MTGTEEQLTEQQKLQEAELYKKMYLHLIRGTLKAQRILKQTIQECEEIFISFPEQEKEKQREG